MNKDCVLSRNASFFLERFKICVPVSDMLQAFSIESFDTWLSICDLFNIHNTLQEVIFAELYFAISQK